MHLIIENADRGTLEKIMRMVIGEFDDGIKMKIVEDTVLLEHTTGQLLWGLTPVPDENEKPDLGPTDTIIELELDKEDGESNYKLLQEACLEDLYVVIHPAGSYPVTVPEKSPILVRADLDLNGSELYLTGEKLNGKMFQIFESGSMYNGKLKGTFTREREEGEKVYEGEMLLSVNCYNSNTTVISDMEFSNCWGFAVGGGSDARVTQMCGDTTLKRRDDETYQLIPGYEYFGLFPGVGYNYIISEREGLMYEFFNENGGRVGCDTQLPGIFAVVPEGAVSVKVSGVTKPHLVRQSHFNGMGVFVDNCKFHNNQCLGLVPGYGRWAVSDCESWENGKLVEETNHFKYGTVGFCDIEDCPTAEFIMKNCHSRDEKALLMDGSYASCIMECSGNISFPRGFRSSVIDFKGRISTSSKSEKIVRLRDNIELTGMWATDISPLVVQENPEKTIPIDQVPKNFWNLENIEIHLADDHNTNRFEIPDKVNLTKLTISYGKGSGTPRCNLTNLSKKTDITFRWDKSEADLSRVGAITATGDIYNLVSDTVFVPGGHTIYDSEFVIDHSPVAPQSVKTLAMEKFSGAFHDCMFYLSNGAIPFNSNCASTVPSTMEFVNCYICEGEKIYLVTDENKGRLFGKKVSP